MTVDVSSASAAPEAQQSPVKAEDREKRLAEMEDMLRTIKQATGVGSVEEVLEKVQAQQDRHQQLLKMQSTTDAKLQALRQRKLELVAELNESRYTNDSSTRENQRTIEDFENHLELSTRRFVESKVRADRSAATLNDLLFGVQTLYAKLHAMKSVHTFRAFSLVGLGRSRRKRLAIQWRKHCGQRVHLGRGFDHLC